MQCMRHIGCSSKAASGNVVEFHIGKFHKVTSSIEIISHTFEGGVQKSLTRKLPYFYTHSKNVKFIYFHKLLAIFEHTSMTLGRPEEEKLEQFWLHFP